MQTGFTKAGIAAGIAALSVALGAGQASAAAAPSAYHDGFLRLGNQHAKIVVSVTEDFACPACKQFESISGPTLAKLIAGGKVAVRYRPIALIDRNWAPMTHTDYSARSASAAACVAQDDPAKYLAFHDALFAAQPAEGAAGPDNGRLAGAAAAAGVTAPDAAGCIRTGRYQQFVESSTDAALMQITGTPAVQVNGANVDDPTPANILAAIAKAEGR